MVKHQFYLIFLALVLFIGVLNAERVRYDDVDFVEDKQDGVIQRFKRFLRGKKTTTEKPSSDAIAALLTTTQSSRLLPSSSRSSIFGDNSGKDSKNSLTTKSRFGATRSTTGSPKDACGLSNPCKNGGTCKTLSSGRFYCFCSQDYYGKTCENKFITSGAANKDRAATDHCAKSPCRNGGECVGLRTTFYCRCKSPYYGEKCDKKIGGLKKLSMDSIVSNEN